MHTKYAVETEPVDDRNSTEKACLVKTSEVPSLRCPKCGQYVYPPETFGGSWVCPEHGTEPFERPR